jgi:phosphonoacetaldehyde hydrolase
MARIRGIVFDVAGTLVDYGSQAPMNALRRVFREHCGITVGDVLLSQSMGKSKWEHFSHIASAFKIPLDVQKHVFKTAYLPIQYDEIHKRAEWIPGVVATLHELARYNIHIACTTGYTGDMMEIIWNKMMKDRVPVDVAVTTDTVFCRNQYMSKEMIKPPIPGRPSPAMIQVIKYIWAMPSDAMVKVGDTVADVLEGKAAGMRTVAVTETGVIIGTKESRRQAMEKENADLIVDDVPTAASVMKAWF